MSSLVVPIPYSTVSELISEERNASGYSLIRIDYLGAGEVSH
jgi:hypothetical protein